MLLNAFNYGPAEHLRNPLAVGQALIDRVDRPVARRVIVAGVHNDGA
jgi:hypothetical protein